MLTDVIVVFTKKLLENCFSEVMNEVRSQVIFSPSYRHLNFLFKPVEVPLEVPQYTECWLKSLLRWFTLQTWMLRPIQYSLWT